MANAETFFRAGVGACITNGRGAILVLDRADTRDPAWQMPQGGIDPGEEPTAAVVREVREETGLPAGAYTITADTDWLVYELPRAYWNPRIGRGQVQRWFACRVVAPDAEIRPDGTEFRAFRWVSPDDVLALAAPFRRALYARVLGAFAATIAKEISL